MNHVLFVCPLLAVASLAQVPAPSAASPQSLALAATPASLVLSRVVHDEGPDGRLWAHGASWKASFGRDGFTFVPWLRGAPRNQPLQFRVAALRVGGDAVPVATDVMPVRDGDRVAFARGVLREVYDLSLAQVEQSFVVDTGSAGDVEVELAIATDLVEDSERPGLQFGCAHGEVLYGDAFLVRGGDKLAIATTLVGDRLRLRVPAALRGDGPVVIDPVLSSRSASMNGPLFVPDVAYDATNDRYLLVWESEFSATDHDIWSELFDGSGQRIANSLLAIDVSTWLAVWPRTADLDDADRFLVAAQFTDPTAGNRRMIWTRTRDAGGAAGVGTAMRLSDPALPGDNSGVDVGADSGTGSGNHDWLVVWTNSTTINDANIHGRLVRNDGQPRSANTLPIETAGTTFNANVQVSKGNGNGQVVHPMWCVVYSRYFGANVAEVHCHTVNPNGGIGAEVPIATSQVRNLFPQVSSPILDGTRTRFLVTYELQTPLTARAVAVAFNPAWQSSHFFDLTQQFGLIGQWLRTESDGVRFVVASKGFFADEAVLHTLAWTGAGLVLHDGPQFLQSSIPTELCACRNSGGAVGAYAAGFLHGTPSVPWLARYGGWTSGPAIGSLPTACSPLQIQGAGFPALGATLQFTLTDFGSDFPGFVFGGAAAIPIPICSTCSLGLRFDLPIELLLATASASIRIPTAIGLVGQSYAMQGFRYGSSPCLGGFAFSDTITFTIR